MSKIAVAVLNRKGGVGKTTIAVILAELALIRKNKVLAVDLDPSRNFSDALGFLRKSSYKDSLRVKTSLEDSDADSSEEWIVIDCPPNLEDASRNAINFADITVVPVRPDFFSLSNLGVMYSIAQKFGKDRLQLPLVKVGYDNAVMTKIANQIIAERNYPVAGDLPIHKHIPYNITSGRVWSMGLIASSRQPYEKLFERIAAAVEKMKAQAPDVNEVWSGKEEDTENADI